MPHHRTRHIVSIGDSSWERRLSLAVDKPFELDSELSDVLPLARVHVFKFSVQIVTCSTPDELFCPFDTIANYLDALWTSDESLDLKLVVDSFGNRSIIAHHGRSLFNAVYLLRQTPTCGDTSVYECVSSTTSSEVPCDFHHVCLLSAFCPKNHHRTGVALFHPPMPSVFPGHPDWHLPRPTSYSWCSPPRSSS